MITRFAPAKINLTLKVGPPEADGRHPLDSLVVFASDIGDTVTVTPSERLFLEVTGPFAAGLTQEPDNLVLRAARLLADHAGREARAQLSLDKHLPVASGIGGGSADAAAALHALNDLWATGASVQDLAALGAKLGADVPACVFGTPLRMLGTGETIGDAPDLPPLPVLLVNPGVACPTGTVYRTHDSMGAGPPIEPSDFPQLSGFDEALRFLAAQANDLERAAIACVPEIGALLSTLSDLPNVRLARMSGSGATCFALFETLQDAHAAQHLLASTYSHWAKSGMLNDNKKQTSGRA